MAPPRRCPWRCRSGTRRAPLSRSRAKSCGSRMTKRCFQKGWSSQGLHTACKCMPRRNSSTPIFFSMAAPDRRLQAVAGEQLVHLALVLRAPGRRVRRRRGGSAPPCSSWTRPPSSSKAAAATWLNSCPLKSWKACASMISVRYASMRDDAAPICTAASRSARGSLSEIGRRAASVAMRSRSCLHCSRPSAPCRRPESSCWPPRRAGGACPATPAPIAAGAARHRAEPAPVAAAA